MTEQPPTRPPGWYLDASGVSRWWDGRGWGDPAWPSTTQQVRASLASEETVPARNGLGRAALILGILGMGFGVNPLLFFLAGFLGIVGLTLGIISWMCAGLRHVTNSKAAIAGVVTSLLALWFAAHWWHELS